MTHAEFGQRGVILIALLWILTALSMIALSFSRETFVEVAAARNARDLAVSYYAARAGIAATVYQIMQRRLIPRVRQLELPGPPDPIDLGLVQGKFDDAEYRVVIQDESAKVNLNTVGEEQLRALLAAVGINKPDADIIADSVMDWRDADILHRPNGAEDDYYQTLNPPYKAKNGRMDTVEELLLVRGVTRDYYYGHVERTPEGTTVFRYGLSRYFTVYATNPRVNVNYADVEVLLSVPGMTPQIAQQIYERRKTKPFVNLEEVMRLVPGVQGPNTMALLSTDPSQVYTLTSSAHRENSKAARVIRAVVTLDAREPSGYRVLYWNENVPRW
jgi:general secretion pathway protein K